LATDDVLFVDARPSNSRADKVVGCPFCRCILKHHEDWISESFSVQTNSLALSRPPFAEGLFVCVAHHSVCFAQPQKYTNDMLPVESWLLIQYRQELHE
jgi:hypothetical protein